MEKTRFSTKQVITIIAVTWILSLITTLAVVTLLPESDPNKKWHTSQEIFLGQDKHEETFHISGEKWRFTWEFSSMSSIIQFIHNIRVYDSNGKFIDGLSITDIKTEKGVMYIHQGQGDYTIKILGLVTFDLSITVEDYY